MRSTDYQIADASAPGQEKKPTFYNIQLRLAVHHHLVSQTRVETARSPSRHIAYCKPQQMLRLRDMRAIGREFDDLRARFWALSVAVGACKAQMVAYHSIR